MRTRDLRPGFFENEDLAALDPWVRLLFQGLWLLAERSGVLEDRPKRIAAKLFPYETYDVDFGLSQLAKAGFIQRYAVESKNYIIVIKFSENQRFHPKESNGSLPLPQGMIQGTPGDDLDHPQPRKDVHASIYEVQVDPEVQVGIEDPVRLGVPKNTRTKKPLDRYRGPDRSGNPREAHKDFPNIFLSLQEACRLEERFANSGLRLENHSIALQCFSSWLEKKSNLANSVEHYSALIDWPLIKALEHQAAQDRASAAHNRKQSTLTTEERNREFLRAYTPGSEEPTRPHAGYGSQNGQPHAGQDPKFRDNVAGLFSGSSDRRVKSLVQAGAERLRAECKPALGSGEGNPTAQHRPVSEARGAGGRGSARDAGEAPSANDRRSQEVSSPVRQLTNAGASYGSTSGQASAWRSYR